MSDTDTPNTVLKVSDETLKHLESILESLGHDPRLAGAGWRSPDPLVVASLFGSYGYQLFPCNINKAPLVMHGVKNAVSDLRTLLYWDRDKPLRGWCVKTGRYDEADGAAGLWILDIDDAAGYARLIELQALLGPLPKTWKVMSPRTGGGEHWYFSPATYGPDMKTVAHALIHGKRGSIDQKGRGGYAVTAASGHASSKRYYWAEGCAPDETPLMTLPPAWVDAMDKADDLAPKGTTPRLSSARSAAEKRAHDSSSLLIGDGAGYGGFDSPVYKNAIQYFLKAGVEAPADTIIDALREMIVNAPKGPGRDASRYLSGPDLPRIVERARAFVGALKECENVE